MVAAQKERAWGENAREELRMVGRVVRSEGSRPREAPGRARLFRASSSDVEASSMSWEGRPEAVMWRELRNSWVPSNERLTEMVNFLISVPVLTE